MIDQYDMANSVSRFDCVLWKDNSHIVRKALEFEVEGHRRKGGQKGNGSSRLIYKI